MTVPPRAAVKNDEREHTMALRIWCYVVLAGDDEV